MNSIYNFTFNDVGQYMTKFHSKLEQLGVPHPPLDVKEITTAQWQSIFLLLFVYFISYFLSAKFFRRGAFKSFFVPLSHLCEVLYYFPLMLYSMNLQGYMRNYSSKYQPLELNKEIFQYLIIAVTVFEMFTCTLKPIFKSRFRAANFYRIYTAIPWAYFAFYQPEFFHKIAMIELIYQTLSNGFNTLKNTRFLSILRHLTPFLFASRLAQFSYMTYFNILYFYGEEVQSDTILYWMNQMITICNIIAIINCFEEILKYFSDKFRNGITVFLITFHVFALIGCARIYYNPNFLRLTLETIGLYMMTGLGITCGAHRLWAHRSYKAHWTFRLALMILNSIANQGTIYHWSRDHRVHHKYSEREPDPHNATRGFFYAHMGWLLLKKPEAVKLAGKEIDCSDLLEDPVVRFQKKWDPLWNQSMCFLLPSLYGYYVHGSFWEAFFTLGALRWVMCLHATWTVNSVAHMWGDRPYNPEINPAESFLTSVLAVGEGWHNWHHEYPYDYAASEGGFYTHWNPSKILIDTAAKLNLVYDRKRALTVWKKVQARRHQEEKKKAEHVAEQLMSNPSITNLPSLKDSLPAHVVQKSLILSSISVLRDLATCCLLISIAWYFKHNPIYFISSQWEITNFILFIIYWTLYALIQGTVAFGLWVLGYEAAGGRYCNSRVLNHIVGAALHSLLLIPYRPRRRHRQKEREQASLLTTLNDNQFGIFKTTMEEVYSFGGIILSLFVVSFAFFIRSCGFSLFFHIYIGPWIVLNAWLILYEWVLENGPQNTFEVGLSESHWQLFTGDFLLRSWPKYTKERYYTARFIDFLHHNLSLSHIVQAVDFNVPHYHVKEAFKRLGDLLGDVTSEVKDAKNHLVMNKKFN